MLLDYLTKRDYVCREAKTPQTVYNVSIQGAINIISPSEYGELLKGIYKEQLSRLHATRKGGISQKNLSVFSGYIDNGEELIISYGHKVWRFKLR